MIDNDEIYILDWNIDEEYLYSDWKNNYQHTSEAFFEGPMKQPWYFWMVARNVDNDIVRKFKETISYEFSPRYILHKSKTVLPMHKDLGTECSINILIKSSNPAPIDFASGNTYYYKSALLNTQQEHGVKNPDEDRLILKLSFKDTPFEKVKAELKKSWASL